MADSLPDKFGNKVIAAWLREQNKRPEDLNAIDRLCYAGRRGMGALEYRPELLGKVDVSERVTVEALSKLADRVLRMREDPKATLISGMNEYSSILRVGSSAGGAREGADRLERGYGRGAVWTDNVAGRLRVLAHQV